MDRILLVDDEKIFLKSLKTGLKKLEHVFKTDICFSVNEAIKYLSKNKYGLVITDLRMPKKDGIDLLLYLNKINFKGSSKIMSAHNTEESLEKIKDLGFIDVIAKPFDLDWFKNMIVEFFKNKNDSEKNFGEIDTVIRDICRKSWDRTSIFFESVDLLSIMQVLNIDKRSSALNVDNKGKSGVIHFFKGDIINAEYGNLRGEDAVLNLILTKSPDILAKKQNKKVEKIIEKPFVEFMTNIVNKRKELEKNFENEIIDNNEEERITNKKKIIKEKKMASNTIEIFNESLESLSEVSGFLAGGIYNSSGDVLTHIDRSGNFKFEEIGSLAIELYTSAKSISDKMGIGECNFVETHTEKYVFIHMCIVPGKGAMGILLGKEGNVGLSRHQMRKEGQKLIPEFE